MNNEILKELVAIDDQIYELNTQVNELEEQNAKEVLDKNEVVTFGKITNLNNICKKRYIDIIEKIKAVLVLENKWCDIIEDNIGNNIISMPNINVNFESFDSMQAAIQQANSIILNEDGSINFDGISYDFMEFYRELLNEYYGYSINFYSEKLKTFSNGYSNDAIKYIDDNYKVDGEDIKYNVDGVVFELNNLSDFKEICNAITEYEKKPKIEYIEGKRASEVSPEILARFGVNAEEKTTAEETKNEIQEEKTVELKSGVKAKIKQFKAKADKTIKLIGNKLVKIKEDLVTNLKAYYSDVNVIDEDNVEIEPIDLSDNSNVYDSLLEGENEINSVFENNEDEMEISNIANEKNINNTYEINDDVANLNVPQASADEIKTDLPDFQETESYTQISDPVASVDDTLNGYVQVEKAINNNEQLTEEQKKEWRETLWKDFDNFVEQNPENNKTENLKEVSEKTVNQIDNMNEYEFEDYLKLNLKNDNMNEFNSRVNDYMKTNPNASEFIASKEALKSMVNEVNLVNPSMVIKPKDVQTQNEFTNGSQPVLPQTSYEINNDELTNNLTVNESKSNLETIAEENVIEIPKMTREELAATLPTIDLNQIEEKNNSVEPIQSVYQERTVDTIDKMNEAELNEYIKHLDLSIEEAKQFKGLVKDYKKNYKGIDDHLAKKNSIKLIVDQREREGYEKTNIDTIVTK